MLGATGNIKTKTKGRWLLVEGNTLLKWGRDLGVYCGDRSPG